MNSAIILCAGLGSRMGNDVNKVFFNINGKPLIEYTLKAFETASVFNEIILVCRQEETDILKSIAQKVLSVPYKLVCGGETRQASAANGLAALNPACSIVALHDGARCLVKSSLITECVNSAITNGSGVAAVFAKDTLRKASNGVLAETINRQDTMIIQTPQVFRADILVRAHNRACENGLLFTDESTLVSDFGVNVYYVMSDHSNIKATTKEDIDYIYFMLNKEHALVRCGHGFDSHALVKNRKLIIGGVEIEYDKGFSGHSDADLLTHAITDALLGAAGFSDIGELFPDTDAKYKDICSIELLKSVKLMLDSAGYEINNIDSTVIIEQPKISPHKQNIILTLANALNIDKNKINLKAKTAEGLGEIGSGLCAHAHAVCTLVLKTTQLNNIIP